MQLIETLDIRDVPEPEAATLLAEVAVDLDSLDDRLAKRIYNAANLPPEPATVFYIGNTPVSTAGNLTTISAQVMVCSRRPSRLNLYPRKSHLRRRNRHSRLNLWNQTHNRAGQRFISRTNWGQWCVESADQGKSKAAHVPDTVRQLKSALSSLTSNPATNERTAR